MQEADKRSCDGQHTLAGSRRTKNRDLGICEVQSNSHAVDTFDST
jgi:hypothetical protein